MGVRKLLEALAEHRGASAPLDLDSARGRTFIVDAYGFWLQLAFAAPEAMEQRSNSRASSSSSPSSGMLPGATLPRLVDADIVGGEPMELAAVFERVLQVFVGRGISLVFAVDAPRGALEATSARDKVWDARQAKAQRSTAHHFRYAKAEVPTKSPAHDSEPLVPRLLFPAFRQVLRDVSARLAATRHGSGARVTCVNVETEVDDCIGELLQQFSADAVLTSDTDFVVMPLHGGQDGSATVDVVLLQNVPWRELIRVACGVNTRTPPLPCLTHARVRAALGLTDATERTIVDQWSRAAPWLRPGDALLVAACLAGNDITSDTPVAAVKGNIVGAIHALQQANDASPAAAKAFEGTALRDAVNKYRAVARLESSAQRRLPLHHMIEHAASPAEARRVWGDFLAAVRDDRISSGNLPLVQFNLTFNRLPPYPAKAGSTLPPLESVATFARLHRVTSALLHEDVRRTGIAFASAVASADTVDHALMQSLPTRSWHDAWTAPADAKASLVESTFQLGNTAAAAPSQPLRFASLALWMIHPVIRRDELTLLAAVPALLRHVATTPGAAALLESLCDARTLDERPAPRTLELAHLLASAHEATRSFLALIDAARPDVVAPHPPQQWFSSALLHCFHRLPFRGGWGDELPPAVAAEIEATVAEVERRVEAHAAVSDFLPGESRALSRFSSAWIGALCRDELADMMDAGTAAHVPEGGRVVQSKTKFPRAAPPPAADADPQNSSKLPIEDHMDEILVAINRHSVVCIQGETGCGKSSMIPFYLLQHAARDERVNIVVTQPRRIAATSLARRVASLLGEDEVGGLVGYRIGGGTQFHKESHRTRIRFVTTGYLLENFANHSRLWTDCTHIVLDEVHERSLQADMLSLLIKLRLREWLETNRVEDVAAAAAGGGGEGGSRTVPVTRRVAPKRLVVMSATIQSEMFMTYFRPVVPDGIIPSLFVGARRCHVDEFYIDQLVCDDNSSSAASGGFAPKDSSNPALVAARKALLARLPDDVRASLQQFAQGVRRDPKPALRPPAIRAVADLALACIAPATCVLVFLPGLDEIENVLEAIQIVSSRYAQGVDVRLFVMHSIVDIEEQKRIVEPAAPTECKIVLATNIAETSITIPDVKIVIDVGMSRRIEYDAAKHLRCLVAGWCTASAAKQRAGRAGRVTPGTVIRMYTEHVHRQLMRPFDEADLMPLEYAVLQVRQSLHRYGDVETVMQELVEPPPVADVKAALDQLVAWAALSPAPEYEVQELGRVALTMPCDISMTRAMMHAATLGCACEVAVITAGTVATRPLYIRPLRTFFDDDLTFLQTVSGVCRTLQTMDRGFRSDLHQYLVMFEEFAHLRRHDLLDVRFKSVPPVEIATRQVETFVKYARQFARSLLQSKVVFETHDHQRLQLVALNGAPEGESKKMKQMRFPALEPRSVERCMLQLALADIAPVMVQTSVKHVPMRAKVAAAAPPECSAVVQQHIASAHEGNTIVFQQSPPEAAFMSDSDLSTAFTNMFSTRAVAVRRIGGPLAVILPSGAISGNAMSAPSPVGETAASAPSAAPQVTILRRGGTAAAAAASLTAAKQSQAKSAAPPPPPPLPACCQPTHLPVFGYDATAVPAPHFALHAVIMSGKLHPKRTSVVALTPEMEAVPLAKPQIGCKLQAGKSFREGAEGSESIQFDRWSILGAPVPFTGPELTKYNGLVLATAVQGVGNSGMLVASGAFEANLLQAPHMAMITLLCSGVVGRLLSQYASGDILHEAAAPRLEIVKPLSGVAPLCITGFWPFQLTPRPTPVHVLLEVSILSILRLLGLKPSGFKELKTLLRTLLEQMLATPDNWLPDLSAQEADAAARLLRTLIATESGASDPNGAKQNGAKKGKKEKKAKKAKAGESSSVQEHVLADWTAMDRAPLWAGTGCVVPVPVVVCAFEDRDTVMSSTVVDVRVLRRLPRGTVPPVKQAAFDAVCALIESAVTTFDNATSNAAGAAATETSFASSAGAAARDGDPAASAGANVASRGHGVDLTIVNGRWTCSVCQRKFKKIKEAQVQEHLQSLRHKRNLELTASRLPINIQETAGTEDARSALKFVNGQWMCTVCKRTFKKDAQEATLQAHLEGTKHKRRAARTAA